MESLQPAKRIPTNLDLRVWGMGADGRAFSQHARALNVSSGGALLSDIERDLKIGDTIGVQSGEKKARCKVIWSLNTRSDQKIHVGVQLLGEDCPWKTLLPQAVGATSVGSKTTRRWERHKISLVIALHDERTTMPTRVTATDISASGCYVETLSPFQIGTSLIVELTFATDAVTTRAFVRSCDPQVGMGIEFMGLKPEIQQRFQEYLRAKNPWACSIERQNQGAATKPN